MIWEFSLYTYDIIFINFVKNEVRWRKNSKNVMYRDGRET